MTQVCLLDSLRLSEVLQDAMSWNVSVESLLVSASNGSILAYAFRHSTPSIKYLRTQSTTMTAAYSITSDDVLVFEAQGSGAISVICPVADHILLAVNGPDSSTSIIVEHNSSHNSDDSEEAEHDEDLNQTQPSNTQQEQAQLRSELEVVSQELSSILREELAGLKWPEDI